ncbi:MAG: AAA family ATPase, partial [Candidatus Eremiobacteraeota bacterium]|nr:AAA family ATPase [Candidatus Eremiobacteraeota bacterium]
MPWRQTVERAKGCASLTEPDPADLLLLRADLKSIERALAQRRPGYEWGAELDGQLEEVGSRIREIIARRPLRTNLPATLGSFFGREHELQEIVALLQDYRLVTLVGPGGIGKTRTAMEVAGQFVDRLPDGVWFVELATLSSGEHIAPAIAQTFGIELPSQGDPIEQLARAARNFDTLLVLDNCEHLIEPVTRVAGAMFRLSRNLRLIATSRQSSGLSCERTYRLSPLDSDNAVALFADRARAANHQFRLNNDNREIVKDITERLDGLPLAIELAGALSRTIAPAQLSEQLADRLSVLTRDVGDAVARQRTLRGLLDWSYDLLQEPEKLFFRRLAVFAGSFLIEDAAAVANAEKLKSGDATRLLTSLVDKSLVVAEPHDSAVRYRMLESTRLYALEKLREAGEYETCVQRLLIRLRELFDGARSRLHQTGRRSELIDALAFKVTDVRVALDWASVNDVKGGAQLLGTIGFAWRGLGLDGEGLARIDKFLDALADEEPFQCASLLTAAARLRGNVGEHLRARDDAERAVVFARKCSDVATLADALREYANDSAAVQRFDEAETALREAEALPGIPSGLRMELLEARAFVTQQIGGDLDAAAEAYEKLVTYYGTLGDDSAPYRNALNLAEVEHARGRTQRAVELLREVLPAILSGRDRRRAVMAQANLAGYLASLRDVSGASEAARAAIKLYPPADAETPYVAMAFEHLALALALSGDVERAAVLEGFADAALRRAGYEREFTERKTYAELNGLLTEQLSVDSLARRTAEGAALSPDAAVAL